MKTKFLFGLLFLIFPFVCFPQSKPSKIYYGTGPEVSIQTKIIIHDYSTKIELMSKDKYVMIVKMAMTILDNSGKDYNSIYWSYDDFSSINKGRIWVFDTIGKQVEKTRLSEMRDVSLSGYVSFYDDLRMKYYKPYIKKTPYTIYYEYTKTYSGFFQFPIWTPQFNSKAYVCKSSLEIINTSDIDYRYYIKNFPDSIVEFTELGNTKKWSLKNLKPIYYEPYGQDTKEQLPYISVQLEDFEIDGYKGSFDNWASFGQWSYNLNSGRQELPLETISFIQKLTDTIKNPRDKAKCIYEWMQSETRYVSIQLGIGGWQSMTAMQVDENKYGDCKALSNYTKALLNIAGIESYYSIVNAGSKKQSIDPHELSNTFNHVILCLPLNGDTTWLECTSDDTPFGYISNFTDDRYALLIKDGASQLVKTTKYGLKDNVRSRISDILITEIGGVKGHLGADYHNIFIRKRQSQLKEAIPDQKEELYEIMNINGLNIDQVNYKLHKDKNPSIHESIDFDIRKIASTTSTRMYFPLYYLKKKTKKVKKDTSRINDIIIRRSLTYIDTINYTIPTAYVIKSIPEGSHITTDFGSYESSIIQDGNQIKYIRKEEKYKCRFDSERYNEFVKYKNEIIKADKSTLVLEKI